MKSFVPYKFRQNVDYHFIHNKNAAIDLLDLSLPEAAQLRSKAANCTHTLDVTLNKKMAVFNSSHVEQKQFIIDALTHVINMRYHKIYIIKKMFVVFEVQENGNIHSHANIEFVDESFVETLVDRIKTRLVNKFGFHRNGMYIKPIIDCVDRIRYLYKGATKSPSYIYFYEYTVTPSADGVHGDHTEKNRSEATHFFSL